jgi:hypothetical protein
VPQFYRSSSPNKDFIICSTASLRRSLVPLCSRLFEDTALYPNFCDRVTDPLSEKNFALLLLVHSVKIAEVRAIDELSITVQTKFSHHTAAGALVVEAPHDEMLIFFALAMINYMLGGCESLLAMAAPAPSQCGA